MKAEKTQAVESDSEREQKAPAHHRRLAADQNATAVIVDGNIVYRKND